MADIANYIVFHPENQRELVSVQAHAIIQNNLKKNWKGNIWVDKIYAGNEDPFVFTNPWLYSYCHASQLRRVQRKDSFLQEDSKILFVSGDFANKSKLVVDTVFIISKSHKWGKSPLKIPNAFKEHFRNTKSEKWNRHFKFPFSGQHKSVSHSYEAKLWRENNNQFSFLPLTKTNNRVEIQFTDLPQELNDNILSKIKGKYPILLNESEINILIKEIEKKCEVKVIKRIKLLKKLSIANGKCYPEIIPC